MSTSHSTGTTKGIAVWLRNQKRDADTSFELYAQTLDGWSLVGTWTNQEAGSEGSHEWPTVVLELADEDARGRGASTRYELRHVAGDRTRGVSHLRRVVATDESPTTDATAQGLLGLVMRSLERSQAQVVEIARASMLAQQQAMQLAGAQYAMIKDLMGANVELHARALEAEEGAAMSSRSKGSENPAFAELMKVAGPVLAQKMIAAMNDAGPSKANGHPTGATQHKPPRSVTKTQA